MGEGFVLQWVGLCDIGPALGQVRFADVGFLDRHAMSQVLPQASSGGVLKVVVRSPHPASSFWTAPRPSLF